MNVYEIKSMGERIKDNSYVGRGIAVGKSAGGKYAAAAYFIMGRSENSRNRIFAESGDDVTIFPFDESKVEDPSLIIYSPIRKLDNRLIVTNGDQTDTICNFLKTKRNFIQALNTRGFEPDKPNFTPRISAMLTFDKNNFSYDMSILKSIDENGSACSRFTFSYPSVSGLGHFIHTYNCDGNPIPSFTGEPERVSVPDSIDEFTNDIWNNLDENNRVSLYVRYIDLETGETENRMINKNK